MQSSSQFDGLVLDVFPPREDGLTPAAINIGGGQVAKTFMVAPRVVVADELGQARFELSRQIAVLEQDLVLHGAMVALDLALGHRMIGLATGMRHAVLRKPRTELGGEVGGPIIAQQARSLPDPDALQAGTAQGDGQGVGNIGGNHGRAQLPGQDVARSRRAQSTDRTSPSRSLAGRVGVERQRLGGVATAGF